MTNEEIVQRIKQGDNSLMAELYEQNRRFIYAVVKHIGIQPEAYEDAMQDAYFGLHEAVSGFDADKGYKFLTYAKYYIQTAIQRGQSNVLHVPEHVRDTARKIRRIRDKLTAALGHTPTVAELSRYTGLDAKTLKYTLNIVKSVKSIYESVDGNGDNLTIADSIADTSITFEDDVAAADERRYISETVRAVIDTLPEAEKTAMNFYYLQGLTYKETGQKMGVSIERIRQLINGGVRRLRHKRDVYTLFEEELDRRTAFYTHKGLNAFNTSWTSSTEQTVIERDYMRRNM